MKKIEIIVPVYNEAEGLQAFYLEVSRVLTTIAGYDYAFLFVDDGSSDSSLDVMKALASDDKRVKYLSFSRNFGKEAAIYAGLRNSSGDLTVLMDADLQHPPELIPEMVQAIDSGEWDACGAKRTPGTMSRMFTELNNRMSEVKLLSGATDFMCMTRKFVQAVLSLSENQRFSKGLFAWVGFRVKWFDYIQAPRTLGKSKWNFRKLLAYAIDGITGFSVMPLKMVSMVGTVVFVLALIYILAVLIRTFIYGIDVPGYVTTLVAVLFLGGVVLMSVGILGSYIGRIFMESKNRPIYIEAQTNLERERPTERI